MKHLCRSLTAVAVVTLVTGTFAVTAHAQTPADNGAAAMAASEAQMATGTETPAPTTPAMTEGIGVLAAPGAVTTDVTETPVTAPAAPGPPPPPSSGLIEVAPDAAPSTPPAPSGTEGTSGSGVTPPSSPGPVGSDGTGTGTDTTGAVTSGTDTTGAASTTDTAPVVTVTRIGTDIQTIDNASAAPVSTMFVFATPVMDMQAAFIMGTGLVTSTTDLSMTARAIDAGLIPVVNISR